MNYLNQILYRGFLLSSAKISFRIELYIGHRRNKIGVENFNANLIRHETLKNDCTDYQLNIWRAVSKRKRKTMPIIERETFHKKQSKVTKNCEEFSKQRIARKKRRIL